MDLEEVKPSNYELTLNSCNIIVRVNEVFLKV
jgi:hypothetical protein